MTLEELLAANPDAQAEYDAVRTKAESYESQKAKHKQMLDENQAAKAKAKQVEDELAGLGDLESLKKFKAMFDGNEELKMIAEGKHDEVFNKRTDKLKQDYESKLTAKEQELIEVKNKLTSRDRKVLALDMIQHITKNSQINSALYSKDILREAADAGWTLDDNDNAVLVIDGDIQIGKDGKSPIKFNEWLDSNKELDRFKIAIGGVGANGNTKTKSGSRSMASTDFNNLSPTDKMKFIKEKGEVIY
jgi:hypothetical protein